MSDNPVEHIKLGLYPWVLIMLKKGYDYQVFQSGLCYKSGLIGSIDYSL